MANPWDDYTPAAQAVSNPWDDYTEKPSAQPVFDPRAAMRKAYKDQIESEPWYNQALIGSGGAVARGYTGAKQLLGMEVPDSEVQDQRDAASAIRGTGAGLAGEIGTYLIPSTGLMKVATAIPAVGAALQAGGISAVGTGAALSAGTGAIEGALIPTVEGESKLFNMVTNAAIGGMVPIGFAGLSAAGHYGKSVIGPLFSKELSNMGAGSIINRAVGDKGDDIIRALDSAAPVISRPTAGQAAITANSPEFSALQRIAEDFNPAPRLSTGDAQQAARLAEIQSFGKTPEILEQAIETRSNNAAANYSAALMGKFKTDPELRRILKDPYIQSVLPEVRKQASAASNRGTKLTVGQRLQAIERELNYQINGTPLNKPAEEAARLLMQAKGELTDWMRKNINGYSNAAKQYAADSKQIAEMKIGQSAADILEGGLGSKEKASALARAVSDETKLLRDSGALRGTGLSDQLTPDSMVKLNNVVKELDINARFGDLEKAGSRSNQLKDALGGIVELPKMLNQGVVITNSLMTRLTHAGKIKSMNSLAEIMQDPTLTKKYMELATQREKNALKFLLGAQRAGAIGATSIMETQQ